MKPLRTSRRLPPGRRSLWPRFPCHEPRQEQVEVSDATGQRLVEVAIAGIDPAGRGAGADADRSGVADGDTRRADRGDRGGALEIDLSTTAQRAAAQAVARAGEALGAQPIWEKCESQEDCCCGCASSNSFGLETTRCVTQSPLWGSHILQFVSEGSPHCAECLFGNCSAASIPMLLAEFEEERRLHRGQLVSLMGFGAAFSWGGAVLRW